MTTARSRFQVALRRIKEKKSETVNNNNNNNNNAIRVPSGRSSCSSFHEVMDELERPMSSFRNFSSCLSQAPSREYSVALSEVRIVRTPSQRQTEHSSDTSLILLEDSEDEDCDVFITPALPKPQPSAFSKLPLIKSVSIQEPPRPTSKKDPKELDNTVMNNRLLRCMSMDPTDSRINKFVRNDLYERYGFTNWTVSRQLPSENPMMLVPKLIRNKPEEKQPDRPLTGFDRTSRKAKKEKSRTLSAVSQK